MGSTSDKLKRFYGQFEHNANVLVIINADPDAIASAMAVKRLLWRKTSTVTIGHINIIERPDNLALVNRLGIKLIYMDKLDENNFYPIVMVDSQPSHSECFDRFKPQIIIDHHPETGAHAEFLDIRPKYGATATILTEYLKAAKIKPSTKLATGLFHAIKTDTGNFERKTLIEDVRAFQFLYRHANIHLARKIEQSEMGIDFLKYFATALECKKIIRGRLYSHLGQVTNPDVCVLLADFFLRIDIVDWSIVSGIYKNKLIVIFRNDGLRKHAGKAAQHSFGLLGSAGGHQSVARAEVSIESLEINFNIDNKAKMLNWIIPMIESTIKNRRKN